MSESKSEMSGGGSEAVAVDSGGSDSSSGAMVGSPLDVLWAERGEEFSAIWSRLPEDTRNSLLGTAHEMFMLRLRDLETSDDKGGELADARDGGGGAGDAPRATASPTDGSVPSSVSSGPAPSALLQRFIMLCPDLQPSNLPRLAHDPHLIPKLVSIRVHQPEECQDHDRKFVLAHAPGAETQVVDSLSLARRVNTVGYLHDLMALTIRMKLSSSAPDASAGSGGGAAGADGALTGLDAVAPTKSADEPIITVTSVLGDPIAQFRVWMQEAEDAGCIPDEGIPITLATCTSDGFPSARMVLLKEVDDKGFIFYTNYTSRKGEELAANPRAAIVVYWPGLGEGRSVRIEGAVEKLDPEKSDAYFSSRAVSARVAAWASPQSKPVNGRAEMQTRLAAARDALDAENPAAVIPRPSHWGGFRVVPNRVEFWVSAGRSRTHDRVVYLRGKAEGGTDSTTRPASDYSWDLQQLAP